MLLYIALLLPLVGGALLPLFRLKTVKSRGIYVEAVVLATSVLVWVLLLTRTDTRYELFPIMDGLTLAFRVDGMSCIFAGLVSVLWPLASLYGFEYMTHEERPGTFYG